MRTETKAVHKFFNMDVLYQNQSSSRREWKDVTPRNPCPICGKKRYCTVNQTSGVIMCHYVSAGAFHSKTTALGDEAHFHYPDGHDPSVNQRPYIAPKSPNTNAQYLTVKQVTDIHKQSLEHDSLSLKIQRLSEQWKINPDALKALGIGFGNGFFYFPERNEKLEVIGISTRSESPDADGKIKKRMVSKTRRGLTYAPDTLDREGDILLVEGGSDTAVLHHLGFCVFGRPNNMAGMVYNDLYKNEQLPLLPPLLEDHTHRRIIAIGENDKREDGRWAGRTGAKSIAQNLANVLGVTTYWTLPPEEHKDVRAWHMSDQKVDISSLELNPVLPKRSKYQEPDLQIVPLEEYRSQMADNRLNVIGKAGVYLDRSPTGAGKTYNHIEACRQVDNALFIVQSHKTARELEEAMQEGGIPAVSFPDLNEDTCQNYAAAEKALNIGLNVGETVCVGCPFSQGCTYQSEMKLAGKAKYRIATHQRFTVSMRKLSEGAEYIAIEEDARNLVKPTQTYHISKLRPVKQWLQDAKYWASEDNDPERHAFISHLLEWLEHIEQVGRAAEETLFDYHKPSGYPHPDNWQRKLAYAHKRMEEELPEVASNVDGEVLRSIVDYAGGTWEQLAIRVDRIKGKDGEEKVSKHIVLTRSAKLPADVPVVFSDATMTPKYLHALTGLEIQDITPEGDLATHHGIYQYPQDVTKGTKPATTAGHIIAFAERHPEHERIGVICHKNQKDAIFNELAAAPLPKDIRKRINKYTHWWATDERASNEWLGRCDAMLVIGTPRLKNTTLNTELIRLGDNEAATQDGGWEEYEWESRNGVIVRSKRHAHPVWDMVYKHQTHAHIKQAIGRGRTNLPEGIPVYLVTREELGFDVVPDGQLKQIKQRVYDAAEFVRCCADANKYLIGCAQQWDGVQTAEIAEYLGLSVGQASRITKECEELGFVVRSNKRKGGWMHVSHVEQSQNPEFVPVAPPREVLKVA